MLDRCDQLAAGDRVAIESVTITRGAYPQEVEVAAHDAPDSVTRHRTL